jgi:hypothetical protein
MTTARFIGVASGSGGEGADAVLVETTGVGLTGAIVHHPRSHSRDVRELLLARSIPALFLHIDLPPLDRLIGESEVDAVRLLAANGSISARSPRSVELGRSSVTIPAAAIRRLEAGSASLIAGAGLTAGSDFRERVSPPAGRMPIAALAD